MGVIKQPRKILIQTGDSNSEQSSAVVSEDESGRSTPASVSTVGGPAPPNPVCPALVSRNIGYRLKLKKGRRSKQRFENERLLMTMYGIDSPECEAGHDVCKESTSYFTDLLEGENGHILDAFLNNEESKYFNCQEEEEEEEGTEDKESREDREQRFQAEDAFLRISFRLRQALKKNVPLGMLSGIEETINQQFQQDPVSEFVCEMSSFERLLVHALSAYYSLNSYSMDQNGKRVVKVENPKRFFFKKDPTLAEYLVIRNRVQAC